jgi:hypothetical protein
VVSHHEVQPTSGLRLCETDAPRAGKKRGKQPVWLSKIMQYDIQPAAQRIGIMKRIGWHTFCHFPLPFVAAASSSFIPFLNASGVMAFL